jgi:hypothetical protein
MVFASRSSAHALLMDSIARLMDLPLFNKEPLARTSSFEFSEKSYCLRARSSNVSSSLPLLRAEYAFMIIIHVSYQHRTGLNGSKYRSTVINGLVPVYLF